MCPWWPNNECWLESFAIFHGNRTSIAKKPYIFVIFQGGVGTPFPPSGSAHVMHKLRYPYQRIGSRLSCSVFNNHTSHLQHFTCVCMQWRLLQDCTDEQACLILHWLTLSQDLELAQLSQCMRFPTMWYVRPAKAQTSLHIRAVWSELLLVWVLSYWLNTIWSF